MIYLDEILAIHGAMDDMDTTREEAFGDDDKELLDAAGTLVGGIMAVRSISSGDAADMDTQSDSMLLMQQRGGPRFVTTLVSTGEVLDQNTFMR